MKYLVLCFAVVALGTSGCSSEAPVEAVGEFPALDAACPPPLKCGAAAACEGTMVTVKGRAQLINTYHPGVSGPNEQKKMFLAAEAVDRARVVEVYADDPAAADATFQKIWDASDKASDFSGPLAVTGTIEGGDIQVGNGCSRALSVHVAGPESIVLE
jgi:hypothetical protein